MARPFFQLCHGRTRSVFLIGNLAFKVPYLKSWKWFVRGLLDSMFEVEHRHEHPTALLPILFHIPGGWLNVFPRCEVFTDDKDPALVAYFEQLLDDYEIRNDRKAYETLQVIEVAEPQNFGYYQGRVVATDYGNGKNADLNMFCIEEGRKRRLAAH